MLSCLSHIFFYGSHNQLSMAKEKRCKGRKWCGRRGSCDGDVKTRNMIDIWLWWRVYDCIPLCNQKNLLVDHAINLYNNQKEVECNHPRNHRRGMLWCLQLIKTGNEQEEVWYLYVVSPPALQLHRWGLQWHLGPKAILWWPPFHSKQQPLLLSPLSN